MTQVISTISGVEVVTYDQNDLASPGARLLNSAQQSMIINSLQAIASTSFGARMFADLAASGDNINIFYDTRLNGLEIGPLTAYGGHLSGSFSGNGYIVGGNLGNYFLPNPEDLFETRPDSSFTIRPWPQNLNETITRLLAHELSHMYGDDHQDSDGGNGSDMDAHVAIANQILQELRNYPSHQFSINDLSGMSFQQIQLYVSSLTYDDTTTHPGDRVSYALEPQCFGAGTPIDMWPLDLSLQPGPDGVYDQAAVQAAIWTKPIEQVAPTELVITFDGKGNMVPGFVPQTMTNESKIILDFHGTWVTPGHVYWCAGGKYEGQYAPLIDILRTDGAIQHQDGTLIRASTGCKVGSLEDMLITMAPLVNGEPDAAQARKVRLGTRLIRLDATEVTVMDGIIGVLGPINQQGYFANGQHVSQVKTAYFQEGPLPNPEDYVLMRSQTTLEEIYQANQWEAMRPQMPAPMVLEGGPVQPLAANQVEQMKRNTPMAMLGLGQGGSPMAQKTLAGPSGKSPMNRKARKAAEARQRKAVKGNKQVVH